jgi:hypothetical protein
MKVLTVKQAAERLGVAATKGPKSRATFFRRKKMVVGNSAD